MQTFSQRQLKNIKTFFEESFLYIGSTCLNMCTICSQGNVLNEK